MTHYLQHGRHAAFTCRHFGISRQTFYRWWRRYDPHDLSTLKDRSPRPHRRRQPTWTVAQAQAVLLLRREYPRCGKDKLVVQERATSLAAAHFLDLLIERMPFPIAAVQVDGGSEFAAEFELACRQRGLPLFVLPPRSPKLNGHVERSHRTHHEEFYQVIRTTGTSLLSIASSAAENISTTPRVRIRRSAISPRSNSSSVGNLNQRKPSVTNHADEYTVLRFGGGEIIMGCFQIGRTIEWARAHFFVGREKMARGGPVPAGAWMEAAWEE